MREIGKQELKFIEHIPARELLEKIRSSQEPVVYEHTNLQNAQRPKLDLSELLACRACYDDPQNPKYPVVQSLITYPIERIVYFYLIATLETELQIKDETDLYGYVDNLHAELIKNDFTDAAKKIEATADEQALSIIDKKNRGEPDDPSTAKYASVYDQIAKNFSGQHYKASAKFMDLHGLHTEAEAQNLLTKMAVTDMIYNDQVRAFMKAEVDPLISGIINSYITEKIPLDLHDSEGKITGKAPLKRLSSHEGSDRRTYMLAGAPASGKGSILVKLLREAKEKYNIDDSDMIKINTDTHRLLVSKGREEKMGARAELHVSLNNDESAYISTIAYEKMDAKIDSGRAPHMLIDGVAPDIKRIQLGIKNGGQLDIAVLTVDPEKSIIRAQSRGEKTGRYVQTAYLISAHKTVTTQVYQVLCDQELVGEKPITVSIYDNNVPAGEPPVCIAQMNLGERKAEIFDNSKLAEFRGKRYMESLEKPSQQFKEAIQIRRGSYSSATILSENGYTVVEQQENRGIKPNL